MKTTRLLSNTDLGNKSCYFPFIDFEIRARLSSVMQRLQLQLCNVMYVSFSVRPSLGGHMLEQINWTWCQSGYCLRCPWSVNHGSFEG